MSSTRQHSKQVVPRPPGPPPPGPNDAVTIAVNRALNYLAQVDKLVVTEELQLLEVFTGWQQGNRYKICNAADQVAFYAVELSDFFTTNYMAKERPFEIQVLDNFGQAVFTMRRPLKMYYCRYKHEVHVNSADGRQLGTVIEQFTCGKPRFQVLDARGTIVLWIEGPVCADCLPQVDFAVLDSNRKVPIGVITREFPGFFAIQRDVFGVKFPFNLATDIKAVLIGATFLIDFAFFEQKVGNLRQEMNGNDNHNSNNFNNFNNPRPF